MSENGDSLLAALVDHDLASVIFVRDYVELDFDGPRLSLFAWPAVTIGIVTHHVDDPGYRDALCQLIGRTVTATGESRSAGLVLQLATCAVTVRPSPQDVTGPEIALLRGFPHQDWMVWRTGEAPIDGPEWF